MSSRPTAAPHSHLSTWNLLVVLLFFCLSARAEVTSVSGREVSIRIGDKKVSVGERLDVVNSSGARTGIIKVTHVEQTSASAEIESGTAEVGAKLARKKRVAVEKPAYQQELHERSRYDYDFRVNPIGLITGAIDANFDFRIGSEWTIGLQGAYLHLRLSPTGSFNSDYDITAYGLGVRANWFINGAFKDGFYFGPSLEYLKVTLKTSDSFGPALGTAEGMMVTGLLGYGWFWNHFNLMLAGGYGSVLGASGITIKDSVGNKQTITASLSGLTFELSVGWAF